MVATGWSKPIRFEATRGTQLPASRTKHKDHVSVLKRANSWAVTESIHISMKTRASVRRSTAKNFIWILNLYNYQFFDRIENETFQLQTDPVLLRRTMWLELDLFQASVSFSWNFMSNILHGNKNSKSAPIAIDLAPLGCHRKVTWNF